MSPTQSEQSGFSPVKKKVQHISYIQVPEHLIFPEHVPLTPYISNFMPLWSPLFYVDSQIFDFNLIPLPLQLE